MSQILDPRHVEARRALLDALDALDPQRDAVVVAGAQAIYLHAGPGSLPVADYTTDGDLALDPTLLVDAPTLGELMERAGFDLAVLQGAPEPGIWEIPATIDGVDAKIAVDLIVPTGVAPPGGTRGARLHSHGKRAARKAVGLEAALVDNEPMKIEALDAGDQRTTQAKVAGVAALLVAKTHKLNDRVKSGRDDRLDDKDASDVVRLMQARTPAQVGEMLIELSKHPSAGEPTRAAVERFDALFGSRAGTGIAMASRALRIGMPEDRVQAICLAYAGELKETLRELRP